MRSRGVFLLCACALAACAPSSADAPIPEQWRNIEVQSAPVALGADQVGQLRFRGGVSLRSTDAGFGGWSDLKVMEDNRVVAESDTGEWLEGRLTLDAAGNLTGFTDGRIALMRDENGQPFPNKVAGDAEDLAQLPDGRFAVSFEQTQTIRVYDLNRDGPFGRAAAGPPLAQTQRLASNVGLEGLAAAPDGTIYIGAERDGTGGTSLWRTTLDSKSPAAPIARYPLDLGFGLSSLDMLPDGDLVVLERFYAPVIGVRIRVARVDVHSLDSGQARKTELGFFAPPLALDNFEGVSAVRMPDGVVRLYLIADDNFSPRQRTLLYAFDVVGSGGGAAR